MSDAIKIPIQTEGAPEAKAQIESVSKALDGLADKLADTKLAKGSQLKDAKRDLEKFVEESNKARQSVPRDWGAIARNFNEVRESISFVAERMHALVDAVVRGASDAERMARAQQALGLSFSQAAERAGGYVNSLDLARSAQTAAERGIRLHQDELNALTLVAQNYARTTGREFGDVMENLVETITEGGEELAKFDASLLRVSNQSQFTANDRLAALVVRARQITPAARTAAESMEDLGGKIQSAGRQAASGFVDGIRNLDVMQSISRDLSSTLTDLKDNAYGFGGAMATVFGTLVNLGNVVLTHLQSMATNIVAIVGSLGEFLTNPRSYADIGDRLQRTFAASQRENQASLATFSRDIGGGPERTSMQAEGPTQRDLQRDRRTRTARQPGSGSGQTSAAESTSQAVSLQHELAEQERADLERSNTLRMRALETERDLSVTVAERHRAERAVRDERRRAAEADAELARSQLERTRDFSVSVERQLQRTHNVEQRRTLLEQINKLREDELALQRRIEDREGDIRRVEAERVAEQRRMVEASTRRPGTTDGTLADRIDAARQSRAASRASRAVEDQLNREQSFNERMRELHSERIDITGETVSFTEKAYGALSESLATHFQAIAEGSESVGVALQSVLSEVLKALAKEAFVKSAFYLAEGVASLVSYQYDRAAESFAASALFAGAGALASAGAGALAPSKPSTPSATGGGGGERAERAPSASKSGSGDGGTNVVNVMFGGPQYGTGGVRQAAREIAGVLNRGAVQGGVQLNLRAGAGL